MGSRNSFRGVDAYAVRVIRFKAGQLSRMPCFTWVDVEDLEQEMTMDVLRRLPRFDPARATLDTFLSRIINHCAATLVVKARRRNLAGWDVDLDAIQELPVSDEERIHRIVDVRRTLARLPEEHRRICHLLTEMSPSEIPRQMGMSRATLYRRLVEVRNSFRDAGLEKCGGGVRRL